MLKFNVKAYKNTKKTALLSYDQIAWVQGLEGVQRITDEVQKVVDAIAQHGPKESPATIPHLAKYAQGCRVSSEHFKNGYRITKPMETLEALKGELKGILPSVTFSGRFEETNGTSKENTIGHTGRICLDYDHVLNSGYSPDEIVKIMWAQSCVEWVSVSPSGDGVKVVVSTNYEPNTDTELLPDESEALYNQVKNWALGIVDGVPLDDSSKNINRLCYLPFNPAVKYRESSEPLGVDQAIITSFAIEQKEKKQGGRKRKTTDSTGAIVYGQSIDVSEAPEAIKAAHKWTVAKKGERGGEKAGGRHPWEYVFFSRCNALGVPIDELKLYAAETFSDTYDRDGSRTIDDVYTTQAHSHGEDFYDPFKYTYKEQVVKFTGKLGADAEAREQIVSTIWNTDFLRIVSDTGTGKTTLMREYVAPVVGTPECKFIHTAHTIALVQSIANDYRKTFGPGEVAEVYGKHIDKAAIAGARVVVCVFDSVPAIRSYVPDSFFIIDESHELTIAQGYRRDAVTRVWEEANKAKKTVLLTATPVPFLDRLDIPTLRCDNTAPDIIPFSLVKYEGKPETALIPRLMKPGKHLVLYNSKTAGRALVEMLGSLGETDTSFLHRDNRRTNADYLTLVTGKKLPARITIGTSLLSSGLDVTDENVTVHLVNIRSHELAVQTASRPRNGSKALLYRMDQESKCAPWIGDYITERTQAAVDVTKGLNAEQKLKVARGESTRGTKGINHSDAKRDAAKYSHNTSQGYTVNHFLIFADALNDRDILSTPEEMLSRLARDHARVEIRPEDNPPEVVDVAAMVDAVNDSIEAAEALLWESLIDTPFAALRAVHDATEDEHKQEQIAQHIDTRSAAPEADALRETYPQIFALHTFAPAFRFCRLLSAGYTVEQVVQLVSNGLRGDAAIRSHVSKLYIQIHTQVAGHKSAKDEYRLEKYGKIPEALKHEKGRYAAGAHRANEKKRCESAISQLLNFIESGEETVMKWANDSSSTGARNYKGALKRLESNRQKLEAEKARLQGVAGVQVDENTGLFSSEELTAMVCNAIGEKYLSKKEAMRLLKEWFIVKLHRKRLKDGTTPTRYSIQDNADSVLMGNSPGEMLLRADGGRDPLGPDPTFKPEQSSASATYVHTQSLPSTGIIVYNKPDAGRPTYVSIDSWEGYTPPNESTAPF